MFAKRTDFGNPISDRMESWKKEANLRSFHAPEGDSLDFSDYTVISRQRLGIKLISKTFVFPTKARTGIKIGDGGRNDQGEEARKGDSELANHYRLCGD